MQVKIPIGTDAKFLECKQRMKGKKAPLRWNSIKQAWEAKRRVFDAKLDEELSLFISVRKRKQNWVAVARVGEIVVDTAFPQFKNINNRALIEQWGRHYLGVVE